MCLFFFFKLKTAYKLRISDWSSDVFSSDLPRFANNAARLANRAELIPLLAAKIAAWDAQPLSLALEAEGVPAGPINDLAQVFADPQVLARGMRFRPEGDRKSVVSGKSVSVRVDLGGRRIIKKKKDERTKYPE